MKTSLTVGTNRPHKGDRSEGFQLFVDFLEDLNFEWVEIVDMAIRTFSFFVKISDFPISPNK